VVVLLHDLEQRLFKPLLHTRRRRRRLCSVHPVPNAAACRSTDRCSLLLPPPFRPGLDDGLLMGRGLGIVNEIGPNKAHCLDMS
jgi:hypothetical protein